MKAKIVIRIVLIAFAVIMLLGAAGTWKKFRPFVKAASSVKKLTDHFYYMEFSGDLQLKEYLEKGGARSNEEMASYIGNLLQGKDIKKLYKNKIPLNTGCACISTVSEDGKLFGRNYDWYDLNSAMIVKSNPKNGYKSISTVQMDFLGFGNDFKPDTFGNKYISSAALFVPLDGMNEKGLCVSDLMAGDDEVTHQNTGKSNVTTTLAIRCMLDFCADADEAVEFLKNHDMHSVIGKAHHFAISDASGKTVVVEYINNEMKIIETNAVTNHYLAPDSGKSIEGCENSLMRFNVLEKST